MTSPLHRLATLAAAFALSLAAGVAPAQGAARAKAPVREEDKVLDVYNWSDDIGDDTIRGFEKETGDVTMFSSSAYVNDLANGAVCAVMGWSGDVDIARRRAIDDKWIHYILRPDVSAGLTREVFYANPNRESRKLLPPQLADNPTLFLSPEDLARMASPPQAWSNEIRRLQNRTYTGFTTGS